MEFQILKSLLTLFFFVSITITTSVVASSSSITRPVKPYIIKACKTTPYPRLCEISLTLHASQTKRTQQEFCRATMTSSLKTTRDATSIISKLSRQKISTYEAKVIRDCVDNLKDSTDELRRAIAAIKSLSRAKDANFQLHSIKTWMSAAETDAMTCSDGLSGGAGRKVRSKVKQEVKKSVAVVVRHISNALSLLNTFKYKS
ncbi:21 kDa protein-like [Cucurbita moschata]|uniref:21 kDa protein-like n=1 Tax=Cucurbita moschata TaxID=3662 RepID=A0A6J1FQ13_CUCMO|nr:21 kDa protein-like [Cucurbita moschata]